MAIVSSASSIAVALAWQMLPRFIFCMGIIAPFYLLYSISSIHLSSYATYPIWGYGLFVSLFTWLLLRYKARTLPSIIIIAVLISAGSVFIWPNNFSYHNYDRQPSRFDLSKSKLVDESGTDIDLNSLKGKVVLIDVWYSACYACIRKFPVLQSLHDKYKDDPDVRILSLNYPLKRDNGIRPKKLTAGYSFGQLYFKDLDEYKKIVKEEQPIYLILDKKFKCRYAGDLNLGWNLFIGNAIKIITKLKSES